MIYDDILHFRSKQQYLLIMSTDSTQHTITKRTVLVLLFEFDIYSLKFLNCDDCNVNEVNSSDHNVVASKLVLLVVNDHVPDHTAQLHATRPSKC